MRNQLSCSSALNPKVFNTLRKQAPATLKAPLDRVARHWNALHRDQTEDYQIYPAIADLFILSLQKAVSAITEHLTDQPDGNANALILAELTKRVHGTFPDADVKVKPMVTLSSINTDASKAQKAVLAGLVEEMFDEADNWLGVE